MINDGDSTNRSVSSALNIDQIKHLLSQEVMLRENCTTGANNDSLF
jgi:hypothetical protein